MQGWDLIGQESQGEHLYHTGTHCARTGIYSGSSSVPRAFIQGSKQVAQVPDKLEQAPSH